MRARLLKPKVLGWGFLIVAAAAIFFGPVRTVLDLAAIQNAVQRDWEISFGYSTGSDKPAFLPVRLDDAAYDFFDRRFGYTHGYDGSQPAKTRNRDIVYRERFRAFFRGPIEDAHVYDFEAFRGDLGAALTRLPRLRRVTAWAMESDIPESEWTRFCTHLRTLPHLEELEIGGSQLTDHAIAPLAGHPQLRSLSIVCGRLTASSTKTFTAIPRLTKLHIEDQIHDGDIWLSPAQQAAMTAALPNTQIDFP